MVSQYEENPHVDNAGTADNAGQQTETSFANLCERYPELDGLTDLEDEQKIEVFRNVLGTLNDDLNSQQRV